MAALRPIPKNTGSLFSTATDGSPGAADVSGVQGFVHGEAVCAEAAASRRAAHELWAAHRTVQDVSKGAGTKREQAARAERERQLAEQDPAYRRWRFGDRAYAKPERPPPRRKPATRRQSRDEADAAYRAALGVSTDELLPKVVGPAQSGGAARGGQGASRKGRGRNS